jgi:Tfp pilus assembly protein PilF
MQRTREIWSNLRRRSSSRKAKAMARKYLYNKALGILAVGLVLFSFGCESLELASPNPTLGWSQDGRRERITQAKQADVQIALARVAESQGDLDGAEHAYRAALSRDKKRGDAHLHLANLRTLRGDYRQAQQEYQKAIEINPGNADIFCDMGYSLYLQHKWTEAERNLKQAILIDASHQRAHNNLALVMSHTNRSEEALAEFLKAGNSVADSHVNLAFSLSLGQQWQPAREQYRRALAAKPSSDTAKTRLREINRLLVAHESRPANPVATRDSTIVPVSSDISVVRPGNLPAKSVQPQSKSSNLPPSSILASGSR